MNLRLILVSVILLLPIVIAGFYIWTSTFTRSGFRGILTYLLHLLIFLLGWLLGKWTGILLVSLPILAFYFYFLFHLAMVVIPASDPSDRREWVHRMRYFFFYVWGFQYPGWAVTGSTRRIAEININGNQFNTWYSPGLIRAYSHQVVGLTTGITFSRVEAPGTAFTKPFERPFSSVVDLRTQLRTFWIDVVSSDGIPFKALLFTSFAVDKQKWDREIIHRLIREDRLLKDAGEPDYTEGSFPFSRQRIRTLLSTTGMRSSMKNPTESEITYWDEMVLYHIEKAACEVLSQRRFDEIWLPANDYEGACAADDIAEAIKSRCFFSLLCQGIRFYSCRLVNFKFEREKLPEIGEVERQQIATWQADWQRDSMETRAMGKAEAELLRQEARAYAYATLLTSIAEGLQETQLRDPDLPRNMIAMRFIGALEEMLQRQPEGDGKSEASSTINTWKRRFSPGSNRE